MKKNARKLIAILLVCLVFVSLAACKKDTPANSPPPPADSGPPAKRDTLNMGVFLDPGTLDPLFMTGKGGYLSVLRTYSEPLWDYTPSGERFWVLATAYDRIDDLHYTMKVRQGVTFSNGNPLTAEDIYFTMKINSEDGRAFLNVKCVDIEKTNVVDDYTLDVWYTHYDPSQEPGIVQMGIVDHRTYDVKTFTDNPVGTGAYVVTNYVVNSSVTVERRDDYWGPLPEIKTINFKCLAEESQRVNAMETGDIDLALITMKDIDTVEGFGTARAEILNVGASLIACYNMGKDGPLGTVEAREAVSYAINAQAIIDVAFLGRSQLIRWGCSEYFLEVQDRYFNMSDLYTDRFNVDKAKALAEQSGLVGKTLRIVTNGDPNYVTAAEIVQNGLEAIGVNAQIINYDQASYFNFLMSENEYDIAINEPVAPSNLPADIYGNYPVFIPQDWSGPDHDEYIALAQKMNNTYDLAARQDLCYDLLLLFNKHVLWFGLCENPYVQALNKELKNVQYTMSGVTLLQNITF